MLNTLGSLLGRLAVVFLCVWGVWFCTLGLRDLVRLRRMVEQRGTPEEREAGKGPFWFRAVAMLAAIAIFAAVATASVVGMFGGQ